MKNNQFFAIIIVFLICFSIIFLSCKLFEIKAVFVDNFFKQTIF